MSSKAVYTAFETIISFCLVSHTYWLNKDIKLLVVIAHLPYVVLSCRILILILCVREYVRA